MLWVLWLVLYICQETQSNIQHQPHHPQHIQKTTIYTKNINHKLGNENALITLAGKGKPQLSYTNTNMLRKYTLFSQTTISTP